MAEAVAGALLSALLNALVDRLASLEVLNFLGDNRSAITKQVEKLNVTLWSANALLNDAEDKQIKDANIKNWVDMLNQVLFEADNVVDEINIEAVRHGIKGKSNLMRRLTPSSLDAIDRAITRKIETIVERINLLLDQKDRLGLKEGVRSKRLERSPASLILDSSDVYGRDGDKKAIMKLLFSKIVGGGNMISVIPILGMGGVGKTTLARLVYNDNKVKNHFEHRAWVVVSDDFDVFRLAKLTLEGLTGQNCEVRGIENLQGELEKFLSGKKFLLVLDDVWNVNYSHWTAFKSYFQLGAEGSKIIVTTRNEAIGSMMGNVPSHRLKTMSDEDCWQLFSKHAFHSVEPCVFQDLEEISRAIVKKCKGLPLAVMSLAGFLRSVSNLKEWEEVLKGDVWDLHDKGSDEILPSLWLSYSYLPSQLKRCFSYCSIFPKGYEYEKNKIILLWMAEGLLQGKNMEDVGEEYFKTLISRSLFQRSVKKESTVVMHDLVHDLATFVSGKGFCIRLGEDDSLGSLTSKTRHLLYEKKLLMLVNLTGLSKAKCLRTFLARSSTLEYKKFKVNPGVLIKKFECLRVLCLSESSIVEVPKSIGKLKHLRYLDLSATGIIMLPDTICSLYNLQTLLLNGCVLLQKLPPNMGSLVNLRHLDFSKAYSLKRMPLQNWNLKGLRTLSKLVLNDEREGSKIKELKELSQYCSDGSFEIVGLENVVDAKDVLDVGFENKSCITVLTLKWRVESSHSKKDRAILDALKPHVSLRKLNIIGYCGEEFSNWVGDHSFTNLSEVSLSSCTHCCQLPLFERLQSLKKLEICGLCSVKTINWKADHVKMGGLSFSHLKILKIADMDRLQSLSFGTVAFQCLRELSFSNCPQMEALCGGQMNVAFPSLGYMDIEECPKLELSGWPLPSSLYSLSISGGKMVIAQRMKWGLTALEHLTIKHCGGDGVNMDSFPEEGLLPTTLTSLRIVDAPDLRALNGKGLQHLTTLFYLTIHECPKLECLQEETLPASLTEFNVSICPLLEPRLKREIGQDWPKISHVQMVFVNYEFI